MQLPSPSDPTESQSDSGADAAAADAAAAGAAETKAAEERAERKRSAAAPPDSGRRVAPLRTLATRFDVILVALTALVASVLGRAVAPALPGASPGIGNLI